jgi:hypothetical protein
VCLYTSDAYVCLLVCDCAVLIMVDSSRWLYLVVTFIEVKPIMVVSSLRANTGINTIFPLSKKAKVVHTAAVKDKRKVEPSVSFLRPLGAGSGGYELEYGFTINLEP